MSAALRALLARHGLAARRDLGQNFLVDEALAAKLVGLAGVEPADAVLEIGTGLGVLTRALAARARSVATLEVDAGLVRVLEAENLLPASVRLLHADALRADLPGVVRELEPPVRVVANLPYALASPLLRRLLDLRDVVLDWSVMLQRELAVRLLADTGTRDYGSLTVLHRLVARVERRLELHPRCFYPVPRVASTFLRVIPCADAALSAEALARTERVVRAGFGHRRKTLANALREAGFAPDLVRAGLAAAGIEARARAESVAPDRWQALADRLGGAHG